MAITVDYIVNGENMDETVLNRPLQQLATGVDNTTYTAGAGLTLTNQQFRLTNESFTSSEKTKLNGIAAGAEVNVVDSVNGQTGAVNLTFDNYQGWDLFTNGTNRGTITSGENVDFRAGSNVTLSYSATNNAITISSTDTNTDTDTNYYLSNLSFNSGTGVLTATVNGATNQAVDLDGRYLLAGSKAVDSGKLDNLDSTDFARNNAKTDGYIWSRRGSTSAALYATQQSTGYIAEFKQGVGDGTTVARVENDGSIWSTGNITASSDVRIKTNIEVIPEALGKVNKLSGYTFNRTDVDVPRQTGVIAQELLEVLPEAVTGGPTEENPEGHYSVAYGNLVGLLIESVKELNMKVEELEKRIK